MISLTTAASDKVKKIRIEENLGEQGLRVRIIGGGCSGFMYDLFFEEEEPTQNDFVFESNDVKIFCDMMSFQYLDGTEIDYLDELHAAGFKFQNPKAKATCGCGSSFK